MVNQLKVSELSLFIGFLLVVQTTLNAAYGQCSSGASPFTGAITNIQSNEVYCMTSDVTVSSLTIASGGKLYVSNGKKLTISGALTVSGSLTFADGASGSANTVVVGNGTVSNAVINLGKKSYLKVATSFAQNPSSYPYLSKMEMWAGSVVENCGTYYQSSHTYPFIQYLGSESVKAYFIIKKDASGVGPGTHFSNDNNVVVITMGGVSGVYSGLSTHCGPSATPSNCPSWPSGLSSDPNVCNNVETILTNLPEPESACHENTFTKSSDPNTIEYDNIVSGFHATILKESNGTIKVWGDEAAPNGSSSVLSPRIVDLANGYDYSGEPLKVTIGSYAGSSLESVEHQFVMLTTTGLYVWGKTQRIISNSIKSNTSFGPISVNSKADGLPAGVNPSQVKMMFGSYRTLAIVTYSGDAYVLSFTGEKNGDGSSQNNSNNKIWHRVKKSNNDYLTNVVAMRGNKNALMALTADGKIYTWGTNTYLGNGTNYLSRSYATQMSLPSGITPKMIGMTPYGDFNSYYVLGTNGELWALGNNSQGQLGDFTTSEHKSWVRVRKSSSNNDYLPAITWFSPQEHDYNEAAVNALTNDGKLYSWGSNAGQMLGMGSSSTTNPFYMGRGLNSNDVLLAVETGGHTTMIVRECTFKYGYLGHLVDGSMGDGTTNNSNESTFNFSNTAVINLCGAPTAPITKDLKMCAGLGQSVNLNNAFIGNVPNGETLVWKDANGNSVSNFTVNDEATFTASFTGGLCSNAPSSIVKVSFYKETDQPMYDQCLVILGQDLTQFAAQCEGGVVNLSWNTESERNLNRFEVERSIDGLNWEYVTTVGATGNSKSTKSYAARDFTTSETTYYRLKVVDVDGFYEHSYSIVNNCKSVALSCTVFPVPASDYVTVVIGSEENTAVNATIVDMNGRTVYSEAIQLVKGTNSFKVNVQDMNQGVYFLHIDNKDFTPVKLVIQ